MADLEKKATTVGGTPTGDYTESGNPTHNSDGTFGSEGGTTPSSQEPSGLMGLKENSKSKLKALLEKKRQQKKDSIESINVGFLATASEIENNIEKFFPEVVVKKLDEYDCDRYIGILRGNDGIYRKQEDTLINVIGMVRFKGRMKPIDDEEFDKYEQMILDKGSGIYNSAYLYYGIRYNDDERYKDVANMPEVGIGCGFVKSFRGLTLPSQYYDRRNMDEILDGYIGAQPSRGFYTNGMFGSTVYTTLSKGYGLDYANDLANPETNHLMENIVDIRTAKIATTSASSNLQTQVIRRLPTIINKLRNHLNGKMSSSKVEKLLKNFEYSVKNDYGFTNILAGYDGVFADNHQMDIYNLGIVMTKKNW